MRLGCDCHEDDALALASLFCSTLRSTVDRGQHIFYVGKATSPWKDANRKTWIVRMHEADPNPKLPVWSNAARGWVLRVMRSGKYMDADGNFYTQNALTNPCSTKYDPNSANATHIPIQAPSGR
jgi:hypothetical protein